MSQENIEIPSIDASELATLRRVNAELLQTKHTLKARVTELEGERNSLTEKVEKAELKVRAAVIDLPMQRMAVQVSNTPELWITEVAKDFDFDSADDGSIVLKSKDGKAATAPDGKPLEWSHVGLYNLLAGPPYEDATGRRIVYRHLMKYAGPSGGFGRNPQINSKDSSAGDQKPIAPQFGLR